MWLPGTDSQVFCLRMVITLFVLFQTNNVTNQYPEVTKKLKKIYDQWWEETLPLLINENRKISDEFPLHTRFNKQLKESGISDWAPLEN